MLHGEHGGGHQYGHLLRVGSRLEGGTDGDLRLSETYVAAYEAVHRARTLHVGLDGLRGLQLVGGIFIDEAGLQLMLQVGVGGIGETLLLAARGIELDEVARYVFHLALGAVFYAVPRA